MVKTDPTSNDESINEIDTVSEIARARPPLWKMMLQSLAFVIGIGLLYWVIHRAVSGNELSRLQDASAFQLCMLIVCTLVSVVANGAIFWILIRPAARIPMLDIQLVNCVVNLINYLPVRMGIVTRIVHHRKVDHLPYLTMIAWYAAIATVTFMVFGAVLVSTMLRPVVDWWWLAILCVVLLVGVLMLSIVTSHRLFEKRLRGAESILNHRGYLIGAVVFRLVDSFAYGGRLYFALTITGLSVSFRDWMYLTIISMMSGMLPAGSFGFREAAIAYLGQHVTSIESEDGALLDQLAAAAVFDRGSEVLVFVPLGILCLIWMLRKWRSATRNTEAA